MRTRPCVVDALVWSGFITAKFFFPSWPLLVLVFEGHVSSLLDRSRWRGLISDALPLAFSATDAAREIFCILREYIMKIF